MPAQDIGRTWRDWADATFCAGFGTKCRVISRTDSHPDGRWIPAVVLPDPLAEAIAAEVLEAFR
jgi:hypothetical protein